MADMETIEVDGSPMRICVAQPSGKGPHPAMIIMCHGPGLDEFTADVADRLAANGILGAAPDVFHRFPEVEDPAEKRERIDDTEIARDIEAALYHLRAQGALDPARTGIVGHCMGGRMSFLGASLVRSMKVCVVYYGGNMFKPWGATLGLTPYELLDRLNGPVLGFFGLEDENPSPADVDKIEARLKELDVDYEFHRYENAGHAFQCFTRPNVYREEPTKDSWKRMLAFLDERLK